MTRNTGIILLLALFGAPAASADVITDYTIHFTGTGTLPSSGSFTYDETNPHFSSFLVTWDSLSFDLTSIANSPATNTGAPACSVELQTLRLHLILCLVIANPLRLALRLIGPLVRVPAPEATLNSKSSTIVPLSIP